VAQKGQRSNRTGAQPCALVPNPADFVRWLWHRRALPR
jgi:hypothetical protein